MENETENLSQLMTSPEHTITEKSDDFFKFNGENDIGSIMVIFATN